MQIWFRLPTPGNDPVLRRRCPRCGSVRCSVHQHQRERRIVDWKVDAVHHVRVKCGRCGKMWTCHPEGALGLHRTQRVVGFGVVLVS